MKTPIRFAAAALLAATLVNLTGCATPANTQAMVSSPAKSLKQYPFSVSVTTTGGTETNSAGRSEISDADLKAAIEKSIAESKLFSQIVQKAGAGDYDLSVAVVQMDKPMFGTSFTITMETAWILTRSKDKQVVWRKAVSGTHTATFSDAFVGATRLRLALEGAARATIANGLEAVSGADIGSARQATATPAK